MEAITGDKRTDRRLARLESRDAKRIGRRVVTAGVRVMAKGIKAEVPIASTAGHSNKSTKRAIGWRNKKNRRTNVQEAKAGGNVGKKKGQRAPHIHLITIGTRRRQTSSGANRGRVSGNDFVKRAARKTRGAMVAKMRQSARENIAREVRK